MVRNHGSVRFQRAVMAVLKGAFADIVFFEGSEVRHPQNLSKSGLFQDGWEMDWLGIPHSRSSRGFTVPANPRLHAEACPNRIVIGEWRWLHAGR